MLLEKDITFGELAKKYRAKYEELLSPFPVRTEGASPSLISLLVYMKSIKCQEDQKALMDDFEASLFHEEGISYIVLGRESESGEYSLRFEFVPWTIT
jgi:hypothetical protein